MNKQVNLYAKISVELKGDYAMLYQQLMKDTGLTQTKLIQAALDLLAKEKKVK